VHIVMFRSVASHDGSASKYELKRRSVGAFFLSAPSARRALGEVLATILGVRQATTRGLFSLQCLEC
jgi:hypothetical protein